MCFLHSMPSDKAVGFSTADVSPCVSLASVHSITINGDATESMPAVDSATSALPSSRRKHQSFPHRIGFALASTGAKMAVVPALGSAFRRFQRRRQGGKACSAGGDTRSVAIQTSPAQAKKRLDEAAPESVDRDPLRSAATFNSFIRAQRRAKGDSYCPLRMADNAPLASTESLFDSEPSGARRIVRTSYLIYSLSLILLVQLISLCFITPVNLLVFNFFLFLVDASVKLWSFRSVNERKVWRDIFASLCWVWSLNEIDGKDLC